MTVAPRVEKVAVSRARKRRNSPLLKLKIENLFFLSFLHLSLFRWFINLNNRPARDKKISGTGEIYVQLELDEFTE